jgi:hypothetical protein
MSLCIAGMHRSGTSMVTRLLQLCGLELGPQRDLMRPHSTNPEGFWENRRFVRINNAILRRLGGTWDRPPPALSDGADQALLRPLEAEAQRLLRQFRRREPWGWKDPRNCLTLPFWSRLVPGLRVLICVRNPLSVAHSLQSRDGFSAPASFDLWLTYYRRLLAAVPPGDRVVTHYDAYFHDAEGELRRVLDLLGMARMDEALRRACASIHPTLAHHHARADDLAREGAAPELLGCYQDLCAAAHFGRGPVHLERGTPGCSSAAAVA